MTEQLHDHARRHTLREEQRRACVPQVVEALASQPGALDHGLEAVRDAAGVEGPASVRGEDEAPVVVPLLGGEPLLQLAHAVGVQRLRDGRRQVDGAAAQPGLRLDKAELAVDALERVAHRQRPTIEIDIPPTKPERLALAQAHGEGHGVERLQAVAAHGVEELSRLLGVEGMDLSALRSWRADQRRDIAAHEAPLHRLYQGMPENRADVVDAAR